MKTLRLVPLLILFGVVPVSTRAQPAPEDTELPQSPGSASPVTGKVDPPHSGPIGPVADSTVISPTQPGSAASCHPPCRSNYLCHEGCCISSCNPVCADHEICMQGECMLRSMVAGAAHPQQESLAPPIPAPPPSPAPQLTPATPPPGAYTHDGFMLRMALGFGGGQATSKLSNFQSNPDAKARGNGVAFSIDVGGSPVENLILHARLEAFSLVDPVQDGSQWFTTDGDTTLSFEVLGIGLTYYFMPHNLFVTAVVGTAHYSVANDNRAYTSESGLGFNLELGKEWWVSENWGLGIAARLSHTSLSDAEDDDYEIGDEEVSFTGFAVLFSATYQ